MTMHRHAEDRKESARALGFGPYVSEMAYRPGPFDDRAAELSRGDREEYAKAHGRPWPKPVATPVVSIDLAVVAAWASIGIHRAAVRADADHLALGADADREREAEYLAAVEAAEHDYPF